MFDKKRAYGVLAALGTTVAMSVGVTSPAVAGPGDVAVAIDGQRHVTMPRSLQPGVNRFRVVSEKSSAFQLVRHRQGYGIHEAVRDIRKGLDQGHVKQLRRLERNVRFFGGVSSTPDRVGRMTVSLGRGRYWAIDTNAATAPDKFFRFRVRGADTGLGMRRMRTIKAIREADWAPLPRAIPHRGMLDFRNRADDNHFVAMAKLRNSKTVSDFRHWIRDIKNGRDPGRPPVNFRRGTETGVVSPGIETQTNLRVPTGRYVVTCFWPDADMGGQPHAFMGMIRGIRLR